MLKQILFVGIGGAVGSIMRFLISVLTAHYATTLFPVATFIINLSGCFFIGLFAGFIPTNSSLRFLLMVGFCGGFTTFSTFASENLFLLQNNQHALTVIYTALSIILGIFAVWLGMFAAAKFTT